MNSADKVDRLIDALGCTVDLLNSEYESVDDDELMAEYDEVLGKANKVLKDINDDILSDGGWCQCDKVGMDDAYYVPDNIDPFCRKHHWRCGTCHKIVQVG